MNLWAPDDDHVQASCDETTTPSDLVAVLTAFAEAGATTLEVDADEHTPMAMRMLVDLCGDDSRKWEECTHAVREALSERARFWDAILRQLREGALATGS